MMRMRRWLGVIVAAGLVLLLAAGCGSGKQTARYTADGKVILRVSMYNDSSFPEWRAYVEKQCPDVYIEWENNRNAIANVLYQQKYGDMPDLVAIRRFESDSAAKLAPYLADLSSLELTGTYEDKYLTTYQEDGKQYWLPGPGVVDGIVADKDLFDRYGVALPTDLDSFVAACDALKAAGVDPLCIDAGESWTPTMLIQGFGCAGHLSTAGGAKWIGRFTAGDASSVDAAGMSAIADTLRTLRDHGILTADDLKVSGSDASARLIAGQTAMVRRTSDESVDLAHTHTYVYLPFFGKTAADSRLYTYPVFSVAMSKAACDDDAVAKAAKEVMTAMLDQGGQKVLDQSGEGLISYSKGVKLDDTGVMAGVQDLIAQDRCFIRVLVANSFSANAQALKALLSDNADNQAFCSVLDKNLFKTVTPAKVGVSGMTADNVPDDDMVSHSASIIAQVVQGQCGADCVIMDVREAAAPIYRGTYTTADVDSVVFSDAVYMASITGSELKTLLDDGLLAATTFQNGIREPLVDYPALGGLTAVMGKDGQVASLSLAGSQGLDAERTYKVAISDKIYKGVTALGNSRAADFKKTGKTLKDYFMDGFKADGSLPQPQAYFKVQ